MTKSGHLTKVKGNAKRDVRYTLNVAFEVLPRGTRGYESGIVPPDPADALSLFISTNPFLLELWSIRPNTYPLLLVYFMHS